MSTEPSVRERVAGRLLETYRRYLGEPEQLSDVYVGFALFFGGVAFALVGVAVFLWSTTFPASAGIYWQLRELAISLSMVGLPAFLIGVTVLLPVDRRMILAGGVGGVVCIGAVLLFVVNYPQNWNTAGADASAAGVTVYALGVVLVTAAVGAALVSNYIARSRPAPDPESAAAEGGDGEDADSVSEAAVRADIEDAMSNTELSWGGVEKDDTRRLKIRTDDADIDSSGFDVDAANENRSTGSDVDAAVDGLRRLRGGEATEASGEGTDDQADALRELRERRKQDDTEDEGGVLDRLLHRLRERFGL